MTKERKLQMWETIVKIVFLILIVGAATFLHFAVEAHKVPQQKTFQIK